MGAHVFLQVPTETCELHVLPEYLGDYKEADQWKEFAIVIGDYAAGGFITKGDINCDGSVDGNDVSILLEMVLAGGVTELQMFLADINSDGAVDGNDVSILLEIVLVGE